MAQRRIAAGAVRLGLSLSVGVGLGLGLTACAGGDDGRRVGWDPPEQGTGESGSFDPNETEPGEESQGDEGQGDETAGQGMPPDGPTCNPGDDRQCLCDDGLHLGQEICQDDGMSWSVCVCDGDGTGGMDTDGDDSDDGGTTGGSDLAPTEVCYPGEDGSFSTCFDLHYLQPDGYDYPPPLDGNPNYRQPIAFLDLEEIDGATLIAPNFRLNEIAELFKGRYAIVQPHAVVSLQLLRDDVGAINVNSAYRSPDYNAGVGGVVHSRHQYGDGYDLDPISGGLTPLENACTNRGGMLVEYQTHVHCDFRFDDVAEEFYGAPGAPSTGIPSGFASSMDAELERDGRVFTAPASGFEEGEPMRRWTARDAEGVVVSEGLGPVFIAPAEATSVVVRVGAQIERTAQLESPL